MSTIKFEHIAIGDELLDAVPNTNSIPIADRLKKLGFENSKITIVRDNAEEIARALKNSKSSLVIITGGMGSTPDDVTRDGASLALKLKFVTNSKAAATIKKRLSKRGIKIKKYHLTQALVPRRAKILPNPTGLAHGFAVKRKNRWFVFLPGVPEELKSMLPAVEDFLSKTFATKRPVKKIILRFCGITEGALMEQIEKIPELKNTRISYRLNFPEVLLTLYDDKEQTDILHAAKQVIKKLEETCWAAGPAPIEKRIVHLLAAKNKTIATAESCTGGLMSAMITSVPGASKVFEGGVIAYSNEIKEKILHVPKKTLEQHGAVSEQTAKAMARGVKELLFSDIGISITGIAGPSGGTPQKPVGTVCIGVCTQNKTFSKTYRFNVKSRAKVRRAAGFFALLEAFNLARKL